MAEIPTLTFSEWLMSHRRGEAVSEASTLWDELMLAVQETGSKGTLTLKVTAAMNAAGQLAIDPAITISKPRRKLGTGVYYLTDDAKLTRRDPNQGDWVDDLAGRRAAGND